MPSKILLVEDHEDSRQILMIQIKSLGYEVAEAKDGEEALEKAVTEELDLIIMDLGLPKMNGIDVTLKLKENPKTVHIPVVAHTAWSPDMYQEKARQAGIVDYLTKPTPPRDFRRVLGRLLKT